MSTLGIEITDQNFDILFFQSLRLFLPLEDKAGLALLGRELRQGHHRLPHTRALATDIVGNRSTSNSWHQFDT